MRVLLPGLLAAGLFCAGVAAAVAERPGDEHPHDVINVPSATSVEVVADAQGPAETA